MTEVGILVIEDDLASQHAIKNVLDAEGWRVRLLPLASDLLAELATGCWSLVIINTSLMDFDGPVFSILKELSHGAEAQASQVPASDNADNPPEPAPPGGLRVLFLVPLNGGQKAQLLLEQEGLPYTIKPYHLHDFLEKISELLVEAGALAEPMRAIGTAFGSKKRRRGTRTSSDARSGAMFASREDYQWSEEELADFAREEEEDRKKREKELKERYHQ